VLAGLRTEAAKADTVDLDALKLFDVSALRLDDDDRIVDDTTIMVEFRGSRPWLFRSAFSSSPSVAPTSQPVRHKPVTEISDAEYAAARAAVTERQH
jgi:hypothetical protein